MNTNQLRIHLELDYKTVKHHLEVLTDNDLITSADRFRVDDMVGRGRGVPEELRALLDIEGPGLDRI